MRTSNGKSTSKTSGKASKTLDFLRRNLNIGSTSVKEQAYKSLVRPSLEYACSVWDPHLKSDKQNRNGSTEGCEICHQQTTKYI